ncbi:MAG: hypothetical protein V3T61_08175 [Acidobacteriota bacterium]
MLVTVKKMLLFLILAVSVNLALAVPVQEDPSTDFSGTWKLNSEKSDSMPGMGRGGMGRGRRGGGGRGGGESSQSREMTMVISQEGNVLNILREGGAQGGQMEMTLTPGEGPQEISTPGGVATAEAWWEGRELVVEQNQERQTSRGSMTIEQQQTWSLSEDGNTLTQRVKMKTPRGDFDMNLVFDRQ